MARGRTANAARESRRRFPAGIDRTVWCRQQGPRIAAGARCRAIRSTRRSKQNTPSSLRGTACLLLRFRSGQPLTGALEKALLLRREIDTTVGETAAGRCVVGDRLGIAETFGR